MMKKNKICGIVLAFFFLPAICFSQATIYTTAGSVSANPGYITIPVTVSNFYNVASISLALEYDTSVINFDSVKYKHPEISFNNPIINQRGQKLYIAWFSFVPANIGDGTLFEFVFIAGSGATSLIWDIYTQGACVYSDPDLNILPAEFINGYVTTIGSSLSLDLKIFLEGPFNGTNMNTDLNAGGYLPLTQPYNTSPWNYSGTESVVSIPNGNITDWILVEIRDAPDAASATSATMIARQAAFVLNNSSIVGIDGVSILQFNVSINHNLFVVVWHRNHLGILSAYSLVESGGIYSYDFTTGAGQVYGGALGHKEIGTGIWGMTAADGYADGQVDNPDKNDVWLLNSGSTGYLQGDFNMDGIVDETDKINFWVPDAGKGSQVPE